MPLFSCIPLGCRGGVDVIDRTQCSLEEIPSEVERSAHTLEELYLDCNQISEISEKLARCRKLRTLSLAQNKLLRVPSFIGCLKSLEELHLEDNELTDLPVELEDCTNLQILDLRLNLFLRLPDVISRIDSLTQLYLFETSLTQLPADIGCLQNLRCLDVRENQLRVLPPSICDLKNLKQLDVGRNELLLLPMGIGVSESLEELYADHNLLNAIPDSVVDCHLLRVLDISENDILSLPEELGELTELVELNISENRITSLPNSISRLKKLSILKADSNGIAILTTAIGSCTALRELYLSNNQLTNVPSALGNLELLTLLTLHENRLTEIPSTIGNCKRLSILTLRSNQLKELPLEIGRLVNLTVLDLCDNQLVFLPFTTTVLSNLRALWLSVDQAVPRVPLTVTLDPVTRVKVLTCYLLPQGSPHEEAAANIGGRQKRTDGTVHFGEEGEDEAEEEPEETTFVRRGTPHPKPRTRVGLRRQSIDGHFIPHNSEEEKHQTLSLRRKSVGDTPNSATTVAVSNFDEPIIFEEEKKQENCVSAKSSVNEEIRKAIDNTNIKPAGLEEHKVLIQKSDSTGFELTMAGGLGSEPIYEESDNGLFISKISEGGPAETAGLFCRDKITVINDVSVLNERHKDAVGLVQKSDVLELTVLREVSGSENLLGEKLNEHLNGYLVEYISATVQRDTEGYLGFDINLINENSSTRQFVVTNIKNADSVLQRDDRIISINGVDIKNMSLQEVEQMIKESGKNECYLTVQRQNAPNKEACSCNVNNCNEVDGDIAPECSQPNFAEKTTTFAVDEADKKLKATEAEQKECQEGSNTNAKIRKVPPVAPKPKGFKLHNPLYMLVPDKQLDDANNAEPSKLAFSSKIKKFESATQSGIVRTMERDAIPAKKPLVSEHDIMKMKEEEQKKAEQYKGCLLSALDDDISETTFNDFMDIRNLSFRSVNFDLSSAARKKKSEFQMEKAASLALGNCQGISDYIAEFEKRQKWRQARYKSLEGPSTKTDTVTGQVREINNSLGMVAEDANQERYSQKNKYIENGAKQSSVERLINGSTNSKTLGVS
uniref:Protein lap1 n=1 Tax=Syphacia muris TaxID=451379 RepID=A0A0N5API2_9BILA